MCVIIYVYIYTLNKGLMKMKKPLINANEITPACGVCGHGILSADGECVLCIKTGVRALDSSCKKFVYDPLKRIPRRKIAKSEFTAEDFKL